MNEQAVVQEMTVRNYRFPIGKNSQVLRELYDDSSNVIAKSSGLEYFSDGESESVAGLQTSTSKIYVYEDNVIELRANSCDPNLRIESIKVGSRSERSHGDTKSHLETISFVELEEAQ